MSPWEREMRRRMRRQETVRAFMRATVRQHARHTAFVVQAQHQKAADLSGTTVYTDAYRNIA